jgi:hypothetical protein
MLGIVGCVELSILLKLRHHVILLIPLAFPFIFNLPFFPPIHLTQKLEIMMMTSKNQLELQPHMRILQKGLETMCGEVFSSFYCADIHAQSN